MDNLSDKIKELRDATDVSVMVCKKALEEAQGDMEKALLILKREGAKVADKKSSRELKAGVVGYYIHLNGQVGVLVEARSETDFVAKNEGFIEFANDIAMQVAAMSPQFLRVESVPAEERQKMEGVFKEEVDKMDKPEEVKQKVLQGKIDTYIKERTLYTQPFIKNGEVTVGEYINEMIQKFGENIEISKFVRFSAK